MLISAASPPLPGGTLPLGFQYANGVLAVSPRRYDLHIVLHGVTDKYALTNERYFALYGENNPYLELLSGYSLAGIKLYVCDFCLKNSSSTITNADILPFVKPVPFSLNFIYDEAKAGYFTVWA